MYAAVIFEAMREPWKGITEGFVGPYWGFCEPDFPYTCNFPPVWFFGGGEEAINNDTAAVSAAARQPRVTANDSATLHSDDDTHHLRTAGIDGVAAVAMAEPPFLATPEADATVIASLAAASNADATIADLPAIALSLSCLAFATALALDWRLHHHSG